MNINVNSALQSIAFPTTISSSSTTFRTIFDPTTNETHLYIPVTDPAFQRKLDLAMNKNLQYLERIDQRNADSARGITHSTQSDMALGKKAKFIKLFNPLKKQDKTGIGVINESKPTSLANNTDTRLYINNLPSDITEEELGILFGPQGKIKKVKIYVNEIGKCKGDALITFTKPESVLSSIVKLNGLDIGEGHKIIVQRADYSYSTTTQQSAPDNSTEPAQDNEIFFDPVTWIIAHEITEVMRRSLPNEFTFVSLPIVIIANGFSYEADEIEVSETEVKLMIDACKFGDIDVVQSLLLSLSPTDHSSPLWIQLCAAINAAGIFVITFKNDDSAQRFVVAMNNGHGRSILGRETLTVWIPSSKSSTKDSAEAVSTSARHINPYTTAMSAITMEPKIEGEIQPPPPPQKNEDISPDGEGFEEEAADVEDFLNSLL